MDIKGGCNIFNKILDIIYPQSCGICGRLGSYLCVKCEQKMIKNAIFGKDTYENKYFENHFYLFKYYGEIRNLILNYKFREKPYLYHSFMNFFKKYQKRYLQFDFYDIIIPIPISKKRLKQRGYNQSDLITKEIAKILKIEIQNKNLIKSKNNLPQSSLDKIHRENNVTDVYLLAKPERIVNKRILLIDDIFTTGSTVNECSKILKKAGAKKIDIFTIAKD